MKARYTLILLAFCLLGSVLFCGCSQNTPSENLKDFSTMETAAEQEEAYSYSTFFLPELDGIFQPYVGDTMPYYEDGVYYIYYLKDGGDSLRHSIYLTTTTDFVTYKEQDEVVLEAAPDSGQDLWIGTGSVVKVEDKYYFFYTGHGDSDQLEFQEKVMVAVSDNLTSFEKMTDWDITPPAELGQKRDFRDPQAYYDPETGTISLTVTAAQDGVARILKFTLSADLQEVTYDGIIFTNTEGDFWNLECSDTFQLGDKWYLTYSAQDDTLWYAVSDNRFGPYSEAKRAEGKLFYAAKHVEDGENSYMVGWARRSESPDSLSGVSDWGGNLVVQKIIQTEDGGLTFAPVESVAKQFSKQQKLNSTQLEVEAGDAYSYQEAFTCYESFLLSGKFQYTGSGSFGLSFDYDGQENTYKLISISPSENKIRLYFNKGLTLITENAIDIQPNQEYSFTYIQEGSVGVFYIDGMAALTVRIYGASGKPVQLFAENNSVVFSSLEQYTKK
ncbi:MAG: hypothetical protein K2O18_05220 [Oscillospiraceae bacterium]|nr:hypothetical protein [Oscillospiraceae bacterium]